ncbi:MAG TPA: hypothetical protein DCY25_02075 [Bacteroidales bacterium]|nr:hypothetical protein [Bacteroidales bacterium]
MTPSTTTNNAFSSLNHRLISEPYLSVNFALAAVLAFVFVYSGIFSPEKNNYPVVCIHERLTGEPCASCGLSHSFSLILKGKISEAYRWNSNGMRVFIFFAAQLVMRIVFSVFYLKHPETVRQLIVYDTVASLTIFLIAFMPFIKWIFRFL